MFWTDLLDPGMKQTSGPVEDFGTPGSFAFASCSNRHERLPPKKKPGISQVSLQAVRRFFLSLKPHTRVFG
jgi:hypothetical protein